MFFHQALDRPDLLPAEAATGLKTDRIEPKFGGICISFHMDVRGLAIVRGVEEESVGPASQYCRHTAFIFLIIDGNSSPFFRRRPFYFLPSGYS